MKLFQILCKNIRETKSKGCNETLIWSENHMLNIKYNNIINSFDRNKITSKRIIKKKKKTYEFFVVFVNFLFVISYFFYFDLIICTLHFLTHIFFYFYLTQYQFYFVILSENVSYEFKIKAKDKETFNAFMREFSTDNHVFVKSPNIQKHGATFNKYIEIE
jgi:signal transduction histidine kinase